MGATICLMAFIGHFTGDYLLQTDKIAMGKAGSYKYLCIHSLYYGVPFVIIYILLGFTMYSLIFCISIVLAHGLIDIGRYALEKNKNINQKVKYVYDQVLHMITIFGISFYMGNKIHAEDMIINISQEVLIYTLYIVYFTQPFFITYYILFNPSKMGVMNTYSAKANVIKFIEIVLALAMLCNILVFLILSCIVVLMNLYIDKEVKHSIRFCLVVGVTSLLMKMVLFII